jgi:2-oxoglutarate dehydrogenase E2 component (dihydrolipoamide succinyltransferase)
MITEIKAPNPGESITEVLLASWLAENGSMVEKDAEIAEIESDKATLVVYAPAAGRLNILVEAGQTVDVGAVLATLDTSVAPENSGTPIKKGSHSPEQHVQHDPAPAKTYITPLAKNIIKNEGIPEEKLGALHKKRITSRDIQELSASPARRQKAERPEKRVHMSPLRQKIAGRLVSVKNETAMLTTFNEVDMTAVMHMRKKYGEAFFAKHGVKLGLIGFFVKATAIALKENPVINARLEGEEIVFPDYQDICIAVSTPKGLLAPVIRDAGDLSLPETEAAIRDFASRAGENKITLDELRGGTFTISNGGVFGSLLSTPIINPPQSAILGMHKIQDRPVAENGAVAIKPMMYVALSYDHRLIDGKESVGFLIRVRQLVEDPEQMFDARQNTAEGFLKL